MAGLFLLPAVFLVLGSLRLPGLPPPAGLELLPDPVWWGNYAAVSLFVPLFGAAVRNSLVVAAVAVPLTVLVGSLAGFTIATAAPRRRAGLVAASVIALMVPTSALWVPRFSLFRWLGLTDTLVAVGAPALMATSPFFVLLFALAFARVPASLYEAAALEGLSPLQVWRRVGLPLTRPATFAVAVLAFGFHWSNLIDPLLYLSTPEKATLPLVLRQLQALEPANHPLLLAGAVLVTAPAVAAFLLAQRAFLVRTVEG